MNINNNLVQVMGQQFIATVDCLKQSKTTVQKIGFNSQEKDVLESIGFDFESFNKLKEQYGAGMTSVDDIKRVAPVFLYLKQRKADADAVAVAVAVEGQVYLNKNVDAELGVGAEATRYKYMAYINGFINTFCAIDSEVAWFNGLDFVCTASALDDRKTGATKSDDNCLDW
jgi:hypothetical protein